MRSDLATAAARQRNVEDSQARRLMLCWLQAAVQKRAAQGEFAS
jgi:hypothetical protein